MNCFFIVLLNSYINFVVLLYRNKIVFIDIVLSLNIVIILLLMELIRKFRNVF